MRMLTPSGVTPPTVILCELCVFLCNTISLSSFANNIPTKQQTVITRERWATHTNTEGQCAPRPRSQGVHHTGGLCDSSGFWDSEVC